MTYQAPTPDEIKRVAEYWRRVEHLSCIHPTMTFRDSDDLRPTCGECGQKVSILSDLQIEGLRKAPENPEVRARLIAQMDRGGVRFAIDGQWHDVRFSAHHTPDQRDEYTCVSTENVALILAATQA